MFRKFDSLADLKIRIYLWVVPCIVIALISNTLLQNSDAANKFDFFINTTLTIWFIFSWVLLYKNRFVLKNFVSFIS
jgi:hypothetical protein